jgi:hypothetical protein
MAETCGVLLATWMTKIEEISTGDQTLALAMKA